ncbi:MAG: GvpL/GvpF family gas vesicle protein [Nanoarchaeota archaeon]
MADDALYVYGIIKFGFDFDWKEKGIDGKNVYAINQGEFSALVHDCEEKPYTSEEPNKIKELIISHNNILDKAMEVFNGVIPLHFNTIIRKTEASPKANLKKWLENEKGRLENVWDSIKGKKEYGIRIYYDKEELMQGISSNEEIKESEENLEGKGTGLKYLLQAKAKSKTDEIIHNKINNFKQKFYADIKAISEDAMLSNSRISIDEEKDILLNLSVLADKQQFDKIIRTLERKEGKVFSFQIAGPFAPYSFVQNEAQ